MSPSYEDALLALAEARPELVVMTAENRAAIRRLPVALGPRFVDVGICEQTLVGAAAGLALRGRRPVVHALAAFLTMRAFEFVRTDLGLACLPVKLVGYVPGLLSEANGPTHQAVEDVALMRGIPNMQVFCPADEAELVEALPRLLDDPRPCYIRFNPTPPRVSHHRPFRVGEAEWLARGPDATLLSCGLVLGEAAAARERLERAGHQVGLLNLRMPKPLDEAAVLGAARESAVLVTIEDHLESGGLFTAVSELLVRRGQTARVLPISLGEGWFPPTLLPGAFEHAGLSADRIVERVVAALGR